jgi:hypothetical protein
VLVSLLWNCSDLMSLLSPSPDLIAFLYALQKGVESRGSRSSVVVAVYGNPENPQRMPQRQRSGAFCQAITRHSGEHWIWNCTRHPVSPLLSISLSGFIQKLLGLLRQCFLAQITDQGMDLDQLACAGKTLRDCRLPPMRPIESSALAPK